MLVLAGGAYAAALETSVFAVQKLDVVGGTPQVRREVRAALATELGRSLLQIGSAQIERRIAPLPDLVGVSFDRRFPHTLHVRIRAERPVLLLRRGKDDTWLVSARGRVMRALRTPRLSSLPRTWVSSSTQVTVGELLPAHEGGTAAVAVAAVGRATFATPVRFVRSGASELTLVLRSGLEIRLGDVSDLRLKLAIARRILHAAGATAAASGYLDVSVPERPVLKLLNAQVSTGA